MPKIEEEDSVRFEVEASLALDRCISFFHERLAPVR